MTTPEGKVKIKVRRWLDANMTPLQRVAPRGGPFAASGIADDLICYLGTFVAIEAKADRSCKPTALQMRFLREVQEAGGIACVLYGFEEHKLQVIKAECEQRHADRSYGKMKREES